MSVKRKHAEREPRFSVNENYAIRVDILRDPDCEPSHLDAQLLDLSAGGARLSLTTPVRFHEALDLSLHSEELGLHLDISGRVCWLRQVKSDNWLLGCSFEPALPQEPIDRMFDHGLLERRSAPRESVRGQALAEWELNKGEVPVGILDLSPGGFSVLSPVAAQTGSRLRLVLDSPEGAKAEVLATIRWQLQVEGGYVVGCEFANTNYYYGLMRQLLCSQETQPLARRSRRFWLLACAAALLALASWYCLYGP